MAKAAPPFSLTDQNGVVHKLTDYLGRWLVVYFYPRDNALNCTREACNFRDEYRIISQFGNAQILGINRGSVASHKKFAERHKLNFPILSDPNHKVTLAYGAWRSNKSAFFDKPFGTRRNTYIIDPDGKIVQQYLSPNPSNHAQEVIAALRSLQDDTLVASP